MQNAGSNAAGILHLCLTPIKSVQTAKIKDVYVASGGYAARINIYILFLPINY
jgi:hypothetical protein